MTHPQLCVVRRMKREDAAAVAGLTSQLGYPATEADIQRRFDSIQGRSDARLFVATHGQGAVVGWIHVQVTSSLENDARAEIWGLVVAETARGTGVGGALVSAAEDWARGMSLKMMAVRSNAIRVQARGFYEHLGYAIVKTQNAFRKTL
jgi:GNAT superfamily N-acetyltransferase